MTNTKPIENKDFAFRDLLAFPFMLLSGLICFIGLKIGGSWTAKQIVVLSFELKSKIEKL